jgi:hypothetical protein
VIAHANLVAQRLGARFEVAPTSGTQGFQLGGAATGHDFALHFVFAAAIEAQTHVLFFLEPWPRQPRGSFGLESAAARFNDIFLVTALKVPDDHLALLFGNRKKARKLKFFHLGVHFRLV